MARTMHPENIDTRLWRLILSYSLLGGREDGVGAGVLSDGRNNKPIQRHQWASQRVAYVDEMFKVLSMIHNRLSRNVDAANRAVEHAEEYVTLRKDALTTFSNASQAKEILQAAQADACNVVTHTGGLVARKATLAALCQIVEDTRLVSHDALLRTSTADACGKGKDVNRGV